MQRTENGIFLTLKEYEEMNMIHHEFGKMVRNIEILTEAVKKLNKKVRHKKRCKDVRVPKKVFLEIYNAEFNEKDNGDICGNDVTVHWNGLYCNCGDGATAYNHIIHGIASVLDEDDTEY